MDYMMYAIELAKRGLGYVNPNPLVGAVIVKDGEIIGEGWHKKYGGPHAEINALNSLKGSAEGADMYVTLEPCAHYGKTPPCAKAVAASGIKRVFIGVTDPNPLVAGKGIKILREAGIEVTCGVCEKECRELNSVFIKYITEKTPYVIMKTAMSLDGKIASITGESQWISCEESRSRVQLMRRACMGIMVGINTVLADDPRLTCRICPELDPIRIVIDSKLRIPENARLFDGLPEKRCIIAVGDSYDEKKAASLTERGAEIISCPDAEGKADLKVLMAILGEKGIDSILLEGGATLDFSALRAGIVDEVTAFVAPMLIGGEGAKTPVGGSGFKELSSAVRLCDLRYEQSGVDLMVKGRVVK